VLQNELKRGADDNPAQRQYTFSDEEKQRFREDPGHLLQFRKKIESEINALFGMYFQGSAMSDQFRDVITEEMNRRLGPGHEELKKFIIPKWSPGCRRISPGDGFLEALVEPNVDCITSDIVGVVPEGVTTQDGVTHKIDILVCATGFQVGFKPVFKLVNDKGVSLQEDWGESVNMYLGLCAPRYPNYFTIVVSERQEST
jgi:cation diffusion facilitator CzcD-associated flavoprotein CzcO